MGKSETTVRLVVGWYDGLPEEIDVDSPTIVVDGRSDFMLEGIFD